MADVNLASLNFKLIVNDEEFNKKIGEIQANAKALNESISEMLNVKGGGLISKEEHESAMRRLREEFQEAQSQQKLKLQWSKETAKMANDEAIAAGKIAQQQEKANNEKKKGLVIDEQIAAATKKKEAAEINAAAATERKVKAERDAARAETQRQTATINQAAAEERRLTAMNNRIRSQQRLNAEMEREGSILRRNSRLWNDMKNVALAYFSFEGARRLVSNLVRVSAEFEKQRVSLHAILQDADGAERIFGQIKALAVQSPFQFKELVTYTKQLSAFSIPMNELYDTTKMLADVSAGLGVGMDRLVLAYGQIRSASFLRGQEVRQLTEAGIPILRELSEMFTELEGHYVSAGEVFEKISKRQVTFEMVAKVFEKMTSEGGKFYQMQEVLAETLSGKISNLTDAYQIMFAEIGEKTSGILNGTVDALRSIAENYQKIGRLIIELVAIYGTYRGMLVAVAAAEKMVAGARMGGEIINMGTAFARAAKEALVFQNVLGKIGGLVSKLNPYAAAAAGVIAVGAAIYNLANRTSEYKALQDGVNASVEDYNSEIDKEMSKLSYLFTRLDKVNKESDEYKRIRTDIINQYGTYLTDIDRENLALGRQETVYKNLANAIRQASMEKALAAGREKISEYMDGISESVFNELRTSLESIGVDSAGPIAQEIGRYLRHEVTSVSAEAQAAMDKIWNKSANSKATSFIKNVLYYANPYNLLFNPNGESSPVRNIDELRDALDEGNKVVEDKTQDLMNRLNVIYGVWMGDNSGDVAMQGWQEDLSAIIKEAKDAGVAIDILVDSQSDLIGTYDEIDKKIKESQGRLDRYLLAGEQGLADAERARLGYFERMQSRLGGSGGGGSTVVGGVADQDTTVAVVRNIQSQISVYRKLQETYESLITTMSDSDARILMSTIFPQYGNMVNANFANAIDSLGNQLLDLAMSSDDAASAWVSFQDTMSEEQLREYNDKVKAAAEATENYKNLMNEWDDFIPSSGAIGDILKDYTKTIEKIQKLREDSLRELANSFTVTDWENPAQAFVEQSNIINEKSIAAEEATLNEAKEKAKKAIEDVYKEWRDVNVDFNNLSDKTINQLNKVIDTIKKFSFANLKPEEQNALLTMIPDLELINQLIDEFKGSDIDKTQGEKTEKNVKAWKQLAKNIVSSSRALKEFASASNNAALEGIADTITNIGDLVQNMADGFRNGGELGAVIAGVTTVANIIMKSATDAARLRAELEKIKQQQLIDAIDERINSSSTIFGDSWLGKIRQIRSEVHGITKEISTIISQGKQVTQSYQPTREFLEALQFYADDLGMALYDNDGLFNTDTLEAIVKKYKYFLQGDNVDSVNKLVEYTKKMKELYKELEESVRSMFDSLSDDIADSLIESLKATGSAVTDLEDVFQSLGDSIFKSMVQSFVIDEILNKYKDEVMSWWTDETLSEAEIAERIRGFANSVKQDIDAADDRLSAMYEAFMQNSLLTVADEAEDKKSLGGGVKSITEDTANLLASYINAIRADVAAIRQSVAAEGAMNLPTPTLAEYLTQIQANTYNNAVAAQAILENLQSMMTMSDGPALRVFM